MKEAEQKHAAKLLEMEQQMMKERLHLQTVADQRVKEMESAAHEVRFTFFE